MIFRLFPAIGAALLLASCAHDLPFAPGPHLQVLDADSMPPSESATEPFRVSPTDKLSVSVYGIPELSQTIQVTSSGEMALPMVGEIHASGLTPKEVSQEIRTRLLRYVRDPQVSVNVEETYSQTFTIDGSVTEPGIYPIVGQMTLIKTVARAKGVSEYARLEDVVVFRTVGDKKYAALYNLGAIRRGTYPDPLIYAGDVIVVGDSASRRQFKDILAALPLISTPIIVLLQSGVF